MLYLSNAFSLSMLGTEDFVWTKEVTLSKVKELLSTSFISAVGHSATADFISAITGIEVPINRVAITLRDGDELLVLQLLARLPEGVVLSKEEVEKVPHKWYLVRLLPDWTIEAIYHYG